MDSTDRSASSCGQYRWFCVGHSTSDNCSIVAFLNQGKFSKGTRSSSDPSNSQKPCFETWVTSATEVIVPGILDLLEMRLNHGLGLA